MPATATIDDQLATLIDFPLLPGIGGDLNPETWCDLIERLHGKLAVADRVVQRQPIELVRLVAQLETVDPDHNLAERLEAMAERLDGWVALLRAAVVRIAIVEATMRAGSFEDDLADWSEPYPAASC